eukprot:766097-Hanusia_phi.AAC.2
MEQIKGIPLPPAPLSEAHRSSSVQALPRLQLRRLRLATPDEGGFMTKTQVFPQAFFVASLPPHRADRRTLGNLSRAQMAKDLREDVC